MALSYYERKARIPYGALSRVAESMGFHVSTVSDVLKGASRNRSIEERLAKLMRDPATNKPVSVTEAFGPAHRSMRRSAKAAA